MRRFPNPQLLGRDDIQVTMPAIWDRKVDGPMFPLTPRRLLLLACHTVQDGRPDDLAFSRKIGKVLDQLEPQERHDTQGLEIDTENLDFIRPWVNIGVPKTWPIDAPALIDAFDEIIDTREEKAPNQ